MLRLEKAHGQQTELGLDDVGLAFLYHQRAGNPSPVSRGGCWLPVDILHTYAGQLAVLAQKLERVDIPAAGAALLVTRGGLERAWPVGPRALRVVGPFYGLRHNLYLGDAAATLAVGGADAVGARVAATNDEDVLAVGGDALILCKLHACQHTVLLRQQLEGQVNAFELAARNIQIAGCGRAGGKDDGVK